MKYINTMLYICIMLIALGGCATPKETTSDIPGKDTRGESVQGNVTIKPSGSYEECIELRPGQVFDYEFESSDYVNFNIHYHSATGLYYPVDKKGVGSEKGTLDPSTHPFYTDEQDNYCLMWDNLNEGPVKVSYKCIVRRK
jgi:hypothetical protein